MKFTGTKTKSIHLIITFIIIFFVTVPFSAGSPQAQAPREWEYTVPSGTCPNGSNQCHWSSPALVDFDGDEILDIVIATNKGHVIVLKADSSPDGYDVLLDKDIAHYIPDMPLGSEIIASSPAVGDIDQDGHPEIIVGFGSVYTSQATRGGIIVLEHTGAVKSGWPKFSLSTKNDGLEKTIFSSPAIGDLDNDGDLEIVVGGFDKRIYAWHHNGHLLPGFPPDSHHINRFPTWDDLVGKLADSIWSSPALGDIDGDGYLDIVIGSDEGNYDSSWGGNADGWTCPYTLPSGWPDGYCGGSVYVLDRFGQTLPDFPKYKLETFQSSPAIADLNQDGSPDIIIGTGEFYYNNSPGSPTHGFKVYAWDSQGNDLPGWEGGKTVGGVVPASPSVGDIAGDERPEVVVIANDKKLYAWDSNGNNVPGFPMTPKDHTNTARGAGVGTGFILADYDGDGKMEIIFKQAWDIGVVDGNGTQLNQGAYQLNGTIYNNPAVGDIDNDGKLELVAFNRDLRVWEFSDSLDDVNWPMFKQGPGRLSRADWPILSVNPSSIVEMRLVGSANVTLNMRIQNMGVGSIDWTATATEPAEVLLSSGSGTVTEDTPDMINVTVATASLGLGTYGSDYFGSIDVTGSVNGSSVAKSPQSLPITVFIVDEIHHYYLPIIQR